MGMAPTDGQTDKVLRNSVNIVKFVVA